MDDPYREAVAEVLARWRRAHRRALQAGQPIPPLGPFVAAVAIARRLDPARLRQRVLTRMAPGERRTAPDGA